MNPPKKRIRSHRPTMRRAKQESDAITEAAALESDARENGMRAYRHWCDRNEPPSKLGAVAMREACPYPRSDPICQVFFEAWQNAAGTLFDHVWVGAKFPERKGNECRVLKRDRNNVEVQFRDGEKVNTLSVWVRRVA